MKFLNIEDFKTSQILLLIVIIILVFPSLLSLPAINKYFDFSKTGNIGDTIGGITAPFLNGLAAILVFIAFKAQIKANEIFKNQEKTRNILEQITLIHEDKLDIEDKIQAIINRDQYLETEPNIGLLTLINKVLYFTSEIRLAYELIEEHTWEKDFIYRKLFYLYVIRYKDLFTNLENQLKSRIFPINNGYSKYINELLFEISYLNKNLDDVNKYKIVLK